jgi:hypothetical protein
MKRPRPPAGSIERGDRGARRAYEREQKRCQRNYANEASTMCCSFAASCGALLGEVSPGLLANCTGQGGQAPRLFPWFVLKMRQALTFLATIENDHDGMKTLAVISILALLTISGAAYTDQLLTSDQQTMQRAD